MPANQSTSRIQNQKEILGTLLREGNMSRTDLARKLGLSKPAVAENVEKLIKFGLVQDVGEGKATEKGGRKPRLISFNRTYRYIMGIDLSFRYPVFAIGDLSGSILLQTRLENGVQNDPEARMAAFLNAIYRLMAAADVEKKNLGAIALCFPGFYDKQAQQFRVTPQFAKWTDLNLEKRLADVFHVPVIVKNDMNAAVLAERAIGCGAGVRSLAYLSCGMGLGAGLVLDGSLYEGYRGAAGELEFHCKNAINAARNPETSSPHTMEDRIGISGLLQKITADARSGRASEPIESMLRKKKELKFEDVINAYLQQDEYIVAQIKEIGEELGFIVSNLTSLLDLELVVLGGEYLVFYDTLKTEIAAVIDRCGVAMPRLEPSSLGEQAGLHGGLLLARNYLLSRLNL